MKTIDQVIADRINKIEKIKKEIDELMKKRESISATEQYTRDVTKAARLLREIETRYNKSDEDVLGDVSKAMEKLPTVKRFVMLSTIEAAGARRTKEASPAVVSNPANPSQTWSGRGRKPKWLIDAEAANAGGQVATQEAPHEGERAVAAA